MHLITDHIHPKVDGLEVVAVPVDRHKLARRRWRGTAVDGTDFGFDLIDPLSHQEAIFATDSKVYVIDQQPESCFLIAINEPVRAAWLGWMIGNLHFKAAFSEEGILVQDDLAVQQMLDREQIQYNTVSRVFQPSRKGGHSHDHEHGHDHSHAY